MREKVRRALLSTGVMAVLAWSPAAFAQDNAPASAGEESDGEEAIVVTARRRDELLQDIPSTVVAVTSEVLEENRITRTAEIGQLVPGLTIEGGTGTNAAGSSTSIRGVATFSTSGAAPLVQYYVNDAPGGRGPDFLMPVIYDIGQIEVIKGPQGTLRGLSSPSGQITITTRMPDLNEIGGYAFGSVSGRGNYEVQGGVGIPLIPDVLALRLAGAYQNTDGDGVKSANADIDPSSKTKSFRGTLRFEPGPDFRASVMYQYLDFDGKRVPQLSGNGNGRNGPVIQPSDRLGIIEAPTENHNRVHFLAGKFDFTFSGQRLSYVGSYRKAVLNNRTAADTANVVRGVEYFNVGLSGEKEHSEELRLSSVERIAGIFDYTVGIFYDRNWGNPLNFQRAAFLSGAFGRPGTVPVEADPLERYTIPLLIDVNFDRRETSFFGNLIAHLLDDRFEVSAGFRHYHSKQNDFTILSTGNAFNAVAFNPALSCSLIPGGQAVVSPVYGAGVCDVPVPGSQLAIAQFPSGEKKFNKWLYNFSASFKVTDNLMIYANTGSAVRGLAPTSGFIGVLSNALFSPQIPMVPVDDLIVHPPETSKNYELGFKSTLFNRRAYFNAAVFKQDFRNFIFLGLPTRYASITVPTNLASTSNRVSNFNFTTSADRASAKGFEIEAGMRVTDYWDFNLGMTYSKSNLKNSLIPCNDGNFDGTPDTIVPTLANFLAAGVFVARCPSSGSISRLPNWVLTARTEVKLPLSNGIEAFFRGNLSYRPDNPNASDAIVIQSYAIANLFAGIREANGVWEVTAFVNNAFNKQQILGLDAIDVTSGASPVAFFPQGSSGYRGTAFTPRREIGLTARYAFGSR